MCAFLALFIGAENYSASKDARKLEDIISLKILLGLDREKHGRRSVGL